MFITLLSFVNDEPKICNGNVIISLFQSPAGFGSEINNVANVGMYAEQQDATFLIYNRHRFIQGHFDSIFDFPNKCEVNISNVRLCNIKKNETGKWYHEFKPICIYKRIWGPLRPYVEANQHLFNLKQKRKFMKRFFKLNPLFKSKVKEKMTEYEYKTSDIAIHIRRGDKLGEAKYVPVDKYVSKAIEIAQKHFRKNKKVKIFFMSDSTDVIEEAINLLKNNQKIIPFYDKKAERKGYRQGVFNRLNSTLKEQHTIDLMAEITMMTESKYVICTFSSNLCRLVQTLRHQKEDTLFSMDVNWTPL